MTYAHVCVALAKLRAYFNGHGLLRGVQLLIRQRSRVHGVVIASNARIPKTRIVNRRRYSVHRVAANESEESKACGESCESRHRSWVLI